MQHQLLRLRNCLSLFYHGLQIHLTHALFAALLHQNFRLRQKCVKLLCQRFRFSAGQLYCICGVSEFPKGVLRSARLQNADVRRERRIQAGQHLFRRHRFRQTQLHDLCCAGEAQRQCSGERGLHVRMESGGIGCRQSGTAYGTLEAADQIQMRDVFGSAQLGKANPNTDVIQKQFLPSFRLIPHPAQALRQCGVVFASCAF